MSLLKIYDSNKFEFQKDIYKNLDSTILNVSGDYIPSWYYESTETITVVLIEELNINKLENKEIEVIESTIISGYTNLSANDFLYSDKFSYILAENKVYRLSINYGTGFYYSDLFKKN